MSVLDDILELTDAVERCIDQGDWLGAGQVNARRQQLLYSLFEDDDTQPLDAATREALREVLRRNQATVARIQDERRIVARTANRLQQNSDAVESYRRAAGSDATPSLA